MVVQFKSQDKSLLRYMKVKEVEARAREAELNMLATKNYVAAAESCIEAATCYSLIAQSWKESIAEHQVQECLFRF